MKKLLFFKLLFLISAMTLLQGVNAYAFTDVSYTDGYAEKVQRLSGLEIINGFSDGTFRPDNTLTRTQFSKIIVCMLDKEDEAKANSVVTPFFDVDQFYWGVPYINYVSRNAVIKGYTDGSFHPEADITLAEAVTVLLRTLGYNEENLGYYWPDNYMDRARSMGLTDGINAGTHESITRAEAAILVDNALFADTNGTSDEFIKSLGYSLVEDAVIIATAAEDETLKANEIKLGDDNIYEVKGFDGFTAMSYAENLVVDKDGIVVSVRNYSSGPDGTLKITEQGYHVMNECYIVASSGDDRNLASDEIRTSQGVYKVKDTDILNKTGEYGTLMLDKDKRVIYALTEETPYVEYVVRESTDGGIEYISSNKFEPLNIPADFPVYVDFEEKKMFSSVTDKFVSGSELTVYTGGSYSYGVLDTSANYSVMDECFIIASKNEDKSLAADQVRTSGGVYNIKSTEILSRTGNIGTAVIGRDNKLEQFVPSELVSVHTTANKLTDNTLEYIKPDGSKDFFKFDNTFVTYFDYNKTTFANVKNEIKAGTDKIGRAS
ncbi:MAG: S-layer homology domain-containing protein, partial [Oscillospiraceae bacterium]|nr:S-layer homology domain-containing protein [Oscillospiraceae bacterium]